MVDVLMMAQATRQLDECEPNDGTNICGAINAAVQELSLTPAGCRGLVVGARPMHSFLRNLQRKERRIRANLLGNLFALHARIEAAVAAGAGLRTALLEISREFEAHPARALPEAAPVAALLAQLLEDEPAPLGSGQVAPAAFGLQATFSATQSW
jgi:hypothetical protein